VLNTESTIFVGVGLYVVLMLVVGFYASKRTHTVSEFIVAGRSMPLALCSMTIVATWFGGGAMMGASGAAYDDGLLGVIEDPLGGALALFLIGFFFARMFRRLRIMTTADFMHQRYGVIGAIAPLLCCIMSASHGRRWVRRASAGRRLVLRTSFCEELGHQSPGLSWGFVRDGPSAWQRLQVNSMGWRPPPAVTVRRNSTIAKWMHRTHRIQFL